MPDSLDIPKMISQDPLFFFENTLDPKVVLDADGRFVAVNRRVEEVTGFSKKELLGKKFFETDLLTLKSKAICVEKFVERMAGKVNPPFEIEGMTKAGDKLHYELNASEIKENGKITGLYVGLRDLTERRKVESELKKANQKLTQLLQVLTQDVRLEIVSLKASLLDLEQSKNLSANPQFKKAVTEAFEIEKTLTALQQKLAE